MQLTHFIATYLFFLSTEEQTGNKSIKRMIVYILSKVIVNASGCGGLFSSTVYDIFVLVQMLFVKNGGWL